MLRRLGAILNFGVVVAFAQSDPVFLLSECSETASVKRVIQSSDVVEIRHSLAGGAETCYSVSVTTDSGSTVNGFLLGARHPAVVRFDRQENAYIAAALSPAPAAKPSHTKAPPRAKSHKGWNPFSTR